jgi:hypothetical protein
MKQPSTDPQIMSLRKLVVNYRCLGFREHVLHLSKWVRRITSSSQLEHLELDVDDFEFFRGPYLDYSGLVEHISYKHGGTIRVFRLMHGHIGSAAISLLCQKCPNLEEVSLGVNMNTLVGLISNLFFSSDLRKPSVARVPPKSWLVVKVTTGRFPGIQHQAVQSCERIR